MANLLTQRDRRRRNQEIKAERAVSFPIGNDLKRHVGKTDMFVMKQSVGRQSSQTKTKTAISLHKQEKTNLWFSFPPEKDCIPFKLRSCMTMSTLFASAIEAFDLHDDGQEVRALRATFADLPEGYPTKSFLLINGFPDTFQIFLEVVEGLSVWDLGGTGTCTVKMDILTKGKIDGER